MPYRIIFDVEPESDWLPKSVFFSNFECLSDAIAVAIEGVDNPAEHDIRIIDSDTKMIVWRSCEEDWD